MITPDTFARYATMHVPRYTSYPTAPNFRPANNGEYQKLLQALSPSEPLSIYLHIPFCREMCWYCGCHTSVTRRQEPISRYVSTLIGEIEIVASELTSRFSVGHVHWGGGSPTLLTPDDVARIHGALKARFGIDPLAENAIEVDPRTISPELALAFARAGVNRGSLGVQTFDAKVQAGINRVQSFETTAAAVQLLRGNGVPAINFDLIYGLPFQSVRSCLETVQQALRLQPDRLSVFGYAHVPSFKPHQRKINQNALPGSEERFDQARAIAEALTTAGYRQIGLDHFALPGDRLSSAAEDGTLHRNFQGYTTDPCSRLLGFGASAIGRLPSGFVQNAPRIPQYERAIAAGRLATVRACRIGADDQRRSAIIEALMCNFRAQLGRIKPDLSQFEIDGLIRRSGDVIEVVEEARPLVRTIAAAFDSYLPNSSAKHAVAV